MKVSIVTISGQKIDTIISASEATIGRSVKCDVVVPDESLSRQHCKIEVENGNFFVTDLGSTNGVYVDGEKIEANARTAFYSYNQLNLGPLECVVEENNSNHSQSKSSQKMVNAEDDDESKTIVHKRSVSDVARETARRPMRKPPPKKENIQGKKASLGMILPVLVILGAIYYYRTTDEVVPETSPSEAPARAMPSYKKNLEIAKQVPNEFKAGPEYAELSAKKGCIGMNEFCTFLKIDEAQHEGIIKVPGEYIVFLNPTFKLTDEKYLKIKDLPDALDLVAMETLITSDFFNEYLLQKIEHIQLVVNDASGKPLRVYRFHVLTYPPNTISRISLLTELGKSFSEANPQFFWDLLKEKVPKKDLSGK
jgi:hypothetical protein